MVATKKSAVLVLASVLLTAVVLADESSKSSELKIFDGKPRLIVVNGYSTSFRWPDVLQRKLNKFAEGKNPIEVIKATRGGTPIAKWIDVTTGEPLEAWQHVRTALGKKGQRPAIVLAQQSLQWAFGRRIEGIRSERDADRIQQGADAIQKYAKLLLKDGADAVFIAMHIYKHPMEPEIGNERLALAEVMKRKIAAVHAGPDVWQPTKEHYPNAFARDKVHPNAIGAEIMAQKWFEALLAHDGLEAPAWSKQEMTDAIAGAATRLRTEWVGTWQAAGSDECKELRCQARAVGGANWEATYTGVCNRRFSFNVTMKGRESGGKIDFRGETDLGEDNGGVYVWTGQIVGKTFTGKYTSAGGKKGTFTMKPKLPAD